MSFSHHPLGLPIGDQIRKWRGGVGKQERKKRNYKTMKRNKMNILSPLFNLGKNKNKTTATKTTNKKTNTTPSAVNIWSQIKNHFEVAELFRDFILPPLPLSLSLSLSIYLSITLRFNISFPKSLHIFLVCHLYP